MNKASKVATVTLNPAIDRTVYVPDFRAAKVNRVEREQFDPGGKGVNVASVLADYGLSVAVTGLLGRENSFIFDELFERKNIDERFVRIAGQTRTGIKIIDEVHQETTDINFSGQTPAEDDIKSLFETVEDLTAECDWFVLAGSIPGNVSADIYRQLIELIKARGRSVALDSSGRALKLAVSAEPTLIKPNIGELRELMGASLNSWAKVVQAGQRLLNRGIETVIISMGERGALFVEADQMVLARPPEVKVRSTVGAGDAMVSGMVAGKVEGLPLNECARLATAFSLSAITQIESGLPSLEAVENFKQQVTFEPLL
jgi:1-phosphofructokinase